MDEKTAYFNDLLVRFEEILYHELSNVAHPKVEYVGVDYLRSKPIDGDSVEAVVESCVKEIKAAGLVEDASYSRGGGGVLLTLNIKNCVHLPMEARLKGRRKNEGGVEPYLCPIANMILDRILNILNFEMVYNAEMETIDTSTGECKVKCAIYENPDKIGMVGDWKSA